MHVSDGKAVFFHYTLTDEKGREMDSTEGHDPLGYIHGASAIIPGLEKALEGRTEGDEFQVTLQPEQAYGFRDENLVQTLSKESFPGDAEVKPGMQFQARTQQGTQILTVTEVEGDQVTVDRNHPLAGQALSFEVEITRIREPSAEEKAHGHLHGSGGAH